MDRTFEKAFKKTMNVEQGYVNNSDDPGGETKFGITKNTARRLGYHGDMKLLTKKIAKDMYHKAYWLNHRYNKIKNEDIALEMFDQAVNMGPAKANENLQKSYNLLAVPAGEKEIAEDGIIGPKTLKAVNSCSKETALFNLLNGYQIKHYIKLAERDDRFKTFIAGWINKRIEIIRK